MIELNQDKVEFSYRDKKLDIKIPEKVTPEVARLDGVIRSDGTVVFGQDHHNDVIVFGHSTDDKPYLLKYVVPLIKKVHGNIPIKVHEYPSSGKVLQIEIHSKAIASFWNKVMGIPNDKRDFKLFPLILKDKHLTTLNLVSYFDGDGAICFSPGTRRYKRSKTKINYYPIITWHTESSTVAKQIKNALTHLGFSPFICRHRESKGGRVGHAVRISGRCSYERFLASFDLNNPKHLTRILIYEIHGFCPPKTSLTDRLKILREEINLQSFYKDKIHKIRPIIWKEREETILNLLSKSPKYLSQLSRETNYYLHGALLRRMISLKQIKCLGIKKIKGTRYHGKFYAITDTGTKRISRISLIKKKLRNQFKLEL